MAFFQVLPKETGFAERFGEGLGAGFGGTLKDQLGQFFQERKEQKALTSVQEALQNLSPEAPLSQKLQVLAQSPAFSRLPQQQQKALASFLQQQAMEQAAASLPDQLTPQDIIARTIRGEIPENLARTLLTPREPKEAKPAPVSPFEKAKQTAAAKKYIELQDKLAGTEAYEDSLSRLRQLTDESSWLGRNLSSLIGGELASEISTLGASVIDPMIKLYNPAGTLPQAKLEWIRKTFAINPKERGSTIKGKMATLERMNRHAQEKSRHLLQLYEEYDGAPPTSALKEIDRESEKFIDKLQRETRKAPEEVEAEFVIMLDPQGVRRKVPRDRANEMKAKGGRVVAK